VRAWRAAGLLGALLLLGPAACSRESSEAERAAWEAEIGRLGAQADALAGRLRELVDADPRRASLPAGDVVIAVPTAFLDTLAQRVFVDVASRVTLTLSGIRTRKQKTLRKGIPIGDVTLDLVVERVEARLAPGVPATHFGADAVTLTLPVEVVEGAGQATVHVFWKGRNVAGAVCGDLDATERVSGRVKTARYVLAGTLAFHAQGAEVVATPSFPETKLKFRVVPSPESWARIDALIASRSGLCRWVLEQVDVKKHLADFAERKGFDVKLPLHKIRPFRFPAGLRESVEVGEHRLGLDVETGTLRIDDTAVWLGARVVVRAEAPAPPAEGPGG
jgi:hypothetical protein